MSSGPALGGQGLPLIPFNQACYGTKLAGAGHTRRSRQRYRQQDQTFVGSAVPYDARRRVTPITAKTISCLRLVVGDLGGKPGL